MSTREAELLDPLVLAMCEKYGYEEQHCHRVAALARALFDALQPLHGLGEDEALLLRHAALLHDIGRAIHHRRHHWHSDYLIRHDTTLSGYLKADRAVLAFLALNHRKRPKSPPGGWGTGRRRRATQLAALLRLADGLDHDRTGTAAVTGCLWTPRRLRLQVSGVDVEGLAGVLTRKAALMEPAFGRSVVWVAGGGAAGAEPRWDLDSA